jgi:hypothetical protein
MRSAKTFLALATLTLAACAASAEPDAAVADGELAGSSIDVAPIAGGKTTKQLVLSGQRREEVPETFGFRCGAEPEYGMSTENVAFLELKNPTSNILSVRLAVQGGEGSSAKLFVYSADVIERENCRSYSTTGSVNVILAPNSSVKTIMSNGSQTGLYTMTATTEVVSAPSPSVLDVVPVTAGSTHKQIFIAGTERHSMPETFGFTCGREPEYGLMEAYGAWVTINNPADKVAVLSVRVTGSYGPRVFAYAGTGQHVQHECLTFSESGDLSGSRSVVVEPHASVQVLIGTQDVTGVYDVKVTTDALVDPE